MRTSYESAFDNVESLRFNYKKSYITTEELMLEAIKKVLFAGIGALALSEEKSREIVAELIKQGEITAQDGEKLLSEMRGKFTKTGKSVEEKILATAKEYLHIQDLENRISRLEKEFEAFKK